MSNYPRRSLAEQAVPAFDMRNCRISDASLDRVHLRMAKRGQLRWRPKRMRIRQNAYSGNGADREGTRSSRPEVPALALSSSSERLDYIAAMVQQLKIMAAQANYRKLAGILELAHHEAMRQQRSGK